jgi:hypothetical protein
MVSISVSAQMSEKLKVDNQKKSSQKQKSLKPSNTHLSKSVSFWSDDFSDPSTWVVDHDATACNLDWEIGVGLTGCPQMEDFMSTTANNGFAMVDSDEYGGEEGGTEVEDSWFTTANPIDLSNASSAKIQFESYYEKFNSEQCFLVISTTNDDWPELTPNYDPSSNPNVFDLFTNQESLTQGSTAQGSNPGTYEVNISSVAANQPEVWIRFHWTGTYGYSWFVDDVSIVEMQPNDISLNYGYLSNVSSIEYGRIPVSQVNDTLILGGEVLNAGSNNQMDITIQASISNSSGNEILSITASQESLESDSLAYVENSSTGFAPLAVGTYTLDVTASSAMDNSAGEYFNDNTYSRNFEITENLYSIDGFDVYENANANMSGIGTTSWESDQDGLIIMNMYEIVEETTTSGLVAEIATNTQVYSAGAEIVPFLLSLDAWNEDDVYNRLVEGDFISVNSWNMEEGKIWLPFDETVLNPGTYLACVELYSGNGANHVAILDDQTVAQPWFASSIYMPSDQTSYSNGIACAIRLGVDNYVAIEENGTDNKVSVSPNPSTGVFTVSSNSSDIKTIEVVNILGELIDSRIIDGVLNETFDMTLFSAGMYFVKSSNGTSVSTQRVIIK